MRMASCLTLLALFSASLPAADEPFCDQSESRLSQSPEGHWRVSIQERVCATANGAVAGVTVEIAAADTPTDLHRVVVIAVPRSRTEWPQTVWRGESMLEVWVPNLAQVVEVKPGFRDVAVTLKYCADDPAARAAIAGHQQEVLRWREEVSAWVRRRDQDPATAGARPPQPKEPRVARLPCLEGDIPR